MLLASYEWPQGHRPLQCFWEAKPCSCSFQLPSIRIGEICHREAMSPPRIVSVERNAMHPLNLSCYWSSSSTCTGCNKCNHLATSNTVNWNTYITPGTHWTSDLSLCWVLVNFPLRKWALICRLVAGVCHSLLLTPSLQLVYSVLPPVPW